MCRCDECKLKTYHVDPEAGLYPRKSSFDDWKRTVDAFVLTETSKATEELSDQPWWKWWHEEETPRAAVDIAKEDWGIE